MPLLLFGCVFTTERIAANAVYGADLTDRLLCCILQNPNLHRGVLAAP